MDCASPGLEGRRGAHPSCFRTVPYFGETAKAPDNSNQSLQQQHRNNGRQPWAPARGGGTGDGGLENVSETRTGKSHQARVGGECPTCLRPIAQPSHFPSSADKWWILLLNLFTSTMSCFFACLFVFFCPFFVSSPPMSWRKTKMDREDGLGGW